VRLRKDDVDVCFESQSSSNLISCTDNRRRDGGMVNAHPKTALAWLPARSFNPMW
jgi:hypothetical protein